jgi:transposase-like protein
MRMTLSTFKRLFQEYQESGLNIKDFCANQSLAPSTFYYWRNKLEETSPRQPASFVPLVFDSNQPATDNRTVQPLVHSCHTTGNNAPIEFVFPNGTKMVLRDNIDMRLLKAIVHLFD